MRTNRFDPFPPYGDGVTTGGGVPLYGDAVTMGGGPPLYGDAVTIMGGLVRDSLPEMGELTAAPNAATATTASMSAPNDLRTEHRPFLLSKGRTRRLIRFLSGAVMSAQIALAPRVTAQAMARLVLECPDARVSISAQVNRRPE